MIVEATRGDLTAQQVDAVVNAANPALSGGGGVDGALHRRAGPDLLAACLALPEVRPAVRCPTGEARLTAGFGLSAPYVLHAVGPVYAQHPDAPGALAQALRSSLGLAVALGVATVAVPALSCGAYGYPVHEAARILVGVARERGWALQRVRFVTFDLASHTAFERALAAVPRFEGPPDPAPCRRAADRDDAAIAGVIREVMPTFGASGAGFALHDPEVEHMAAAYRAPRSAYFVVERDGRVVGGCGIAPLAGAEPSVGELRKMYFLPEARGTGAGERLLRQVLALARGYGYQRCYLETLTGMDAAQRLYERVGFRSIDGPLGSTGHFGCNRFYLRESTAADLC